MATAISHIENPSFDSNQIRILIGSYLNPTLTNVIELKLLFGLKLEPLEVLQLLQQPFSLLKIYITELLVDFINFINNEEIILSNYFIDLQRIKEEDEAIMSDQEAKRQEKLRTILRELDLQHAALRLKQIQEQGSISYLQTLQLHKYDELNFFRSIVTDDNAFAKIFVAINKRYEYLESNLQRVDYLEEQLQDSNLSSERRDDIKERITLFKDHIRLSSLAMKQKIIPEYINDPEKAVHVAQQAAVIEEFWSVELKEKQYRESTAPAVSVFFNHDKENTKFQEASTNNKWKQLNFEKLRDNLSLLYGDFTERYPDMLLPEGVDFIELLELLTTHKQEPSNELEATIRLRLREMIKIMGPYPELNRIVRGLQSWRGDQKSTDTPKAIEEEKKSENQKEEAVNSETGNIVVTNAKQNSQPTSDAKEKQIVHLSESDKNTCEMVKKTITSIFQNDSQHISEEANRTLERLSKLVDKVIQSQLTKDEVNSTGEEITTEFNTLAEKYADLSDLQKLYEHIIKLPFIDSEKVKPIINGGPCNVI